MISRSSLVIGGPAVVTFASATIFTQSPVVVRLRPETFPVKVDGLGTLDERLKNVIAEISFTPAGEVEAAAVTAFFPHLNPSIGRTAFPNLVAAPNDVVIQEIFSPYRKYTIYNAIVFKQPELILSAEKTVFGQVTLHALGADNTAWTDAAKFYKVETGSTPDLTALSVSAIKTVTYTMAVGALSAPWNAVETKDGIKVSLDVPLQPRGTDSGGTIDYMYGEGASARLSFTPTNVTPANVLDLMLMQSTGAARGASIDGKRYAVAIAGGSTNLAVTVNNCLLRALPMKHSADADVVDELEFVSYRHLTTGTMDALAAISIAS